MSKDRKKLLHIHSSVNDKQPTPATLELGELGVNNAKGNAFISTKNSDGEVVRFSEDETIIDWMEQKEVFPYEGYMRGADSSQVDGVTEQDLLNNKSNIIIKLNQVVPENTDYSPYDEKVNGAKDIYGNLINPISSGGYKDGAGLAIDMSKYAMIGANPSFSSVTSTCRTTLSGTTDIKGNEFAIEVESACFDASDTLYEYGLNHSNFGVSCDGTNISNDTTLKGKKVLIDSPSGDLTVDIQACNHISAKTNDFVIRECQNNEGKVEVNTTTTNINSCDLVDIKTDKLNISECGDGDGEIEVKSCNGISAITDNFVINSCSMDGTTTIKSCGGITLESNNITLTGGDCGLGEITIDIDDLCLVGNDKINVYGEETNIGVDCNDLTRVSNNTNIYGKNITIKADSEDGGGANLCLESHNDLHLYSGYGIYVGQSCDGIHNTERTEITSDFISILSSGGEQGKICMDAFNISLFGGNETNVGINCEGDYCAMKTRVHGSIVEISGDSITEYSNDEILLSAETNVNIDAKDISRIASNNICDNADTNATFYGAEETNIGVDCNGENISKVTKLNGEDVYITALSGYTVDTPSINLDVCESISNRTNHYSITECANKEGQVNIGTNETFVTTNLLKVEDYDNEEGNVIINTSHVTENASTTDIKSCNRLSAATDNFILNECTNGEGKVEVDTTFISVSANTASVKSCDSISAITDNFIIEQCTNGGRTNIHSNTGIRLDSKNITLTDGGNSGQTTVEVNDLCLVGENKVNVYGKETNIGLDCDNFQQAKNTNIYGENITLRTNSLSGAVCIEGESYASLFSHQQTNVGKHCSNGSIVSLNTDIYGGNINIRANGRPNSMICAEGDFVTLYGSTDTNVGVDCSGQTVARNTAIKGDRVIVDSNHRLGITARDEILQSSESNIVVTADSSLLETAGNDAEFFGTHTTNIGIYSNLGNDVYTYSLNLGGDDIRLISTHRINVTGNTEVDGDITAYNFYTTSDRRKKENINDLANSEVEKVDSIQFKSFVFKNDETKSKTYGVIAQDVQDAGFENIVKTDENGMLSVDYTSLLILKIARLEELLKQQQDIINNLLNNK